MSVWQTDDEYTTSLGAGSLSTAEDVPPFKTPSGASKRSSRRSITPPGRGSSPSRMATERSEKRSSRDITTDESISILDPRRFTPTLHANLVSEILALRRDQEEKTKQIESLETTLHSVKEEHEQLQDSLTNTTKESRSLKRQLSLLEGGTSSALGELARERDDAVDSIAETRKRLDAAQKKIRTQEDDSQRVHDLWAQEKDGWEDERRKYERKLHIAESRLKMVLDEVAAYQAAHMNGSGTGHGHDSEGEESVKDNDAGSVRTMSLTNSIRHSLFNGPGAAFLNGHSLADELNFDDDDQTDADGRESVLSIHTSPNKHTRNFSRDSVPSRMHRRNLSMDSMKRSGSVARGKLFMNQAVMEALEGEEEEEEEEAQSTAPKATYTDTGIQYSPPPSPEVPPVKPSTPDILMRGRTPELDSPSRGDSEIEANQRRKRVQISRPLIIEPPRVDTKMVSAAAQTIEEPLSPPRTPKSPFRDDTPPPEIQEAPMVSSSTQTEEPHRMSHGLSPARLAPIPPPLSIPSISIQPPTSRPTTPRSPRLPQHFKHFGCQVNLSSPTNASDAAAQTEGIQTDKRLALLPLHLQPSAISSRPTSPNVTGGAEHGKNFTPVPGNLPARNPRRLTKGRGSSELPSSPINSSGEAEELHDAYPGYNDDGPLSSQKGAPMRRPHRFSSLFAGFDTASSDEVDEFADADLSDSEYRTALSAPRPQSISSRPTRRGSFGTVTTSPDQPTTAKPPVNSTVKGIGIELYSSSSLADKEARGTKHVRKLSRTYEKAPAPPPPTSSRNGVMRRAAMIQSGIASHQGRSRSPSLPDPKNPPFPIPTRASSRKPPVGVSTPSDGQRSPTRGDGWHRRGSSRSSYQTPHSIRKVRSAAALPRNHRYRRHGSRSPPPLSPSTEAPESPGLPPMPRNDITTPRNQERGGGHYRRHRHELSTNTDNTINTEPVSQASGAQPTGVVDAIAQTMVGEWMLKYVRRRKSFGMPENSGKDDSSNDRHKRWVWLAPYERAILWSSKQPSSGSALMGKTGRKLTIQSVLDVKDDNPAPKVMSPVFNRSILILTPQRALKFTAASAERHYLWLTALSFLAHSSQAVPEIIATPQPQSKQQALPEFEMPKTRFKRGGIRDSIRLAKGKPNMPKIGTPSVPSIPSAPSSRMGDVASFRLPDSSSAVSGGHSREQSREAAEPPFIPRFTERHNPVMAHGRKRSNTGGHVAPPLSFRGFSGPAGSAPNHNSSHSTANASVGTAGSSDISQSQASSNMTWGMSQTASQRTSEASSRPGNFFDAIGTVRMEAFISPLAFSQFGDCPDEQDELRHTIRRRSKEMRRRNSRSRHRDNFGPRGRVDDVNSRGRTVEEDYFKDDPFKGF